METSKSVFETLAAINCNEHTEKKNGLTYLSWAWAWQIVKQNYPTAFFTIYEREDGIPYFTDGSTCWVKTGVTIEGLEHIEYLPIMDFRNNSIPLGNVTSTDMNKAIQRSLTKACARHGLGLYIYAGEDLPDTDEQTEARPLMQQPSTAVQARRAAKITAPAAGQYQPMDEEKYWKVVAAYASGISAKSGEDYRTAWAKMTNAGAAQIVKFDNDVANYIEAHSPKKNVRRKPVSED
ncbi:MAG: DUF1071 domain-containing protein [Parasporobacterium sp.]|nr:DUF1071 domain-containing protein [Parasporobacterium sp.]